MQRKRSLKVLLLSFLMASPPCDQAASVEYLTLNVSGTPIVIALAEHPVITYTDNTLHVQTAAKTIDIPVNQISGVAFTETTGITTNEYYPIQLNEGYLYFEQLKPDTKIIVYSVNGLEVLSKSVDSSGRTFIDTSTLIGDVFIIKTDKQTIKVTKK